MTHFNYSRNAYKYDNIAPSCAHYWQQLATSATTLSSIIATFCVLWPVASSEKKRGYIGREFFLKTQNKKNSYPLGPLFFKTMGTMATIAIRQEKLLATLLATMATFYYLLAT